MSIPVIRSGVRSMATRIERGSPGSVLCRKLFAEQPGLAHLHAILAAQGFSGTLTLLSGN
jgi:hypothetical protein